jgi:hypothetical protein
VRKTILAVITLLLFTACMSQESKAKQDCLARVPDTTTDADRELFWSCLEEKGLNTAANRESAARGQTDKKGKIIKMTETPAVETETPAVEVDKVKETTENREEEVERAKEAQLDGHDQYIFDKTLRDFNQLAKDFNYSINQHDDSSNVNCSGAYYSNYGNWTIRLVQLEEMNCTVSVEHGHNSKRRIKRYSPEVGEILN